MENINFTKKHTLFSDKALNRASCKINGKFAFEFFDKHRLAAGRKL